MVFEAKNPVPQPATAFILICYFRYLSMRIFTLWLTLTMLILSFSVHAKPSSDIAKKPMITVGYTSFNWAPLAFKKDKKIIGLLPSLMDAIAAKAGFQVRSICYSSFEDMLSAFKRNEVDLLIGVAPTLDRQKYMVFSDPILSTSFAMLSASSKHTKLSDLKNTIISIENGFAIEQKIIDMQFAEQILSMPSTKVALNAVKKGLADAYIGNGLILQNLYTYGDLQHSLSFSPLTALPFERLYITATKNHRSLINKINQAYDQLPESELTEIYDHWLTNKQQKMLGDPHELHLTTAETNYLQQHKNIRIGYQFPISVTLGINDTILRQLKDTLDHITQKLNITATITPIANYQDAKQQLADNKIDIIAAIVTTRKRQTELAFTVPYSRDKWVMIDRINHKKLKRIDSSDTIGVLASSFGAKLVQEYYPTAKVHQFKTKLDILKAVTDGKINYGAISFSNAHLLIQDNFLGQLKIVASQLDDHALNVAFAVAPNNLILRNIFNKAIDSFPPETLDDIQKKWHTVTLKADGNYHQLVTIIIIFGLVICCIIGAITVWNRRLTNEIKHRKAVEDKLTYLTNNFDGVLIQHHQKSDDPMDIDILFMSEKIIDFTGTSASKFYFFPQLLKDRMALRDDYQTLLTAMRNAVKQGYWRTELQLNTQENNNSRWIELRCQITPSTTGWQWNSILIDITQLKHQQLALTAAKQKSQAATTAKSRFLAMMSHEIRTPISGIICLLDLMKPYAQQPELQQIHQNLTLSSDNLLNIVNDVLDFSKLESKKLKLDLREKQLTKIATILVQPHALHAAQKGLDFKLWIDPNIAHSLRFDSMRLKQVLNNLLNNAIKFTANGSIQLDINLLSQHDNQQIISFKVTDTGIGISAQDIDNLFQPFEQLDQDSARRYDGTGLGLSICHQLIQLMDGSITVASQPDQGTSFTIILTFDICQPTVSKPLHKHCGLLTMANDSILIDYLTAWQCPITVLTATTKEQLAAAVSVQCIDTLFVPQSWVIEHDIDLNWIAINLPSVNWITITSADVMLTSNINARNISLNPLLPNQLYRALTQPFQPYNNDSQCSYSVQAPLTREQAIAENRYVLVAEDHPINQQILKQQLEQLNYAVDIVDNGKQALIALANNNYSLLLTDCHMPEMDGYELTKTIREQEQHTASSPLAIIAVTANALTNTDRFRAMGFNDYLIKPLKQQQLKTVLARWLQPSATIDKANVLPQLAQKNIELPPASVPMMIDIDELLLIFGDKDLCQTLLQQYLTACVEDLEQLNAAITHQNNDSIFMVSHRIKGAARMMAFHQLAQIADELESYSQHAQINKANLQSYYTDIEKLINQLSLQINRK